MCGLFGMFGNLEQNKKIELLKELAILNRSRGKDSVGFADIDEETNTYYIDKVADDPVKFVNRFDFVGGDCVIGHTRHATTGKVTDENAHPWLIQNVIGCHNGFLLNDYEFYDYIQDIEKGEQEKGNNVEFDYNVDSQYLLHLMSEYNHMGIADGYLNLSYWDTRNKNLYLVRYDNPLHVGVSKDKDCIVWSSEYEHLKKAIKRVGLDDYKYIRLSNGKYRLFQQNGRLYSELEPVLFDTTYTRKPQEYIGYQSNKFNYNYSYRDDDYYEKLYPIH